MPVKFNKAQFSGSGTYNYTESGTMAANCKGLFAKFTKKNLAKTDGTRVLILLSKNKEDFSDAWTLPCTKPLSKWVREAIVGGVSHSDIFAVLAKLPIIVDNDDENKYFVSNAQGDGEMLPAIEVVKAAKNPLTMEEVNW